MLFSRVVNPRPTHLITQARPERALQRRQKQSMVAANQVGLLRENYQKTRDYSWVFFVFIFFVLFGVF